MRAKAAKTVRSSGQKLVPIPINEEFLASVDKAMTEAGYANRAQFVRDAIYDKLLSAGVKLERGLSQAPSRAGKGGPRKKGPRAKR